MTAFDPNKAFAINLVTSFSSFNRQQKNYFYKSRLHFIVKGLISLISIIHLAFLCLGCHSQQNQNESSYIQLQVWAHSGQEAERHTLHKQVVLFNDQQDEIQVQLTFLPEGGYNGQVQAAALAGDLPDLLEIDGPYVYNYAWQGKLLSLDKLISEQLKKELLPSVITQGTYNGYLYSIGTFESGLGLYARRSQLMAIGARIPTSPQDAWSVDEFQKILSNLSQRDDDGAVLDLKLNYQGEWYSYGFAPIIQSAGGDLINRENFQQSEGSLNSPSAIAAMQRIQNWIQSGYVDPNIDDVAFITGRVALSWSGHWTYNQYHAAHGDDLLLLPLPNFGKGTRSGQGSWSWGITTSCKQPKAAMRFLEFLFQTEQVLSMAEANGAVPATYGAIEQSAVYAPSGPLHLFIQQLNEGYTIARPQTPAYPLISSVFEHAFFDIRDGEGVSKALGRAVAKIDQDIEDNYGYPFISDKRFFQNLY